MNLNDLKIAVIGLGYVGLPLAAAFGNKFSVVGFDINEDRIAELKLNNDHTLELTSEEIKESKGLSFTCETSDLSSCNFFIVTVPTPVRVDKKPDLTPLLSASRLVGDVLKKDDIVVYESTVYPGATEEECVPVLEQTSSLKFNKDFFVGYSPERINPGDQLHKLKDITKITSGSTPEIAMFIDKLYGQIIEAGTHMASSIKVAEAAKVIENTQRDVNIGLINELALIFSKLDIDTEEVLVAAGTKWNFLPFRPGLVGGHCIGVDPYYLTYKAQSVGHEPKITLAGRELNDSMGEYVANRAIEEMVNRDLEIKKSKALIMGLTFKENCPDLRNSRVFDISLELSRNSIEIDAFDPWVKNDKFKDNIINFKTSLDINTYDLIIIAVAHDYFKEMGSKNIRTFGKENHILFDLKYLFASAETDMRL